MSRIQTCAHPILPTRARGGRVVAVCGGLRGSRGAGGVRCLQAPRDDPEGNADDLLGGWGAAGDTPAAVLGLAIPISLGVNSMLGL